MGILEAALDFFGQKNLQNDAQAFSAEQYAKRYQTQVADMKAAGLNPMLSYGQSPGASPSSAVASTRPGSTYAETNLASAQTARVETETEKVKSDKRVADATAEGIELDNVIKAKYGLTRAEAELNNLYSVTGVNIETQGKLAVESEKAVQEISNLKEQQEQIKALVENLQQTNKLLEKQGFTEVQRAALLAAEARKITAETKIVGFNIDAIQKTGGIGRLAREIEPASKIASDWVGHITDLVPSKHISTVIRKVGK